MLAFTTLLLALLPALSLAQDAPAKGIGANPLGFVTVSGVPGSVDLSAAGIAVGKATPTDSPAAAATGSATDKGLGAIPLGFSTISGAPGADENGVLGVESSSAPAPAATGEGPKAGEGDPAEGGIGARPLGAVSSSAIDAASTGGVLGVDGEGEATKTSDKGGAKPTEAPKADEGGDAGAGKTVTVTKTVTEAAKCTQQNVANNAGAGGEGEGEDKENEGEDKEDDKEEDDDKEEGGDDEYSAGYSYKSGGSSDSDRFDSLFGGDDRRVKRAAAPAPAASSFHLLSRRSLPVRARAPRGMRTNRLPRAH